MTKASEDEEILRYKSEFACCLLIIVMIAKNDTLKTKDLAYKFGRSTRTIEHWLKKIREGGVDLVYRYGHNGYPPGYEIRHIEPELVKLLHLDADMPHIPVDREGLAKAAAKNAHKYAKFKGVRWFRRHF